MKFMLYLFIFFILIIQIGNKKNNLDVEFEENYTIVSENLLEKFFIEFEKKFGHLKKQPSQSLIPEQKSHDSKANYKSLSELYAEKISQNMEKILLMSIDEYQTLNKDLILENKESNQGTLFRIYGKKTCSLDEQGYDELKSVCPWHNELRFRQNMYPHRRVFSKCNCEKCLIHSKYDTDHVQYSTCTPVYTLMPALINVVNEWNFIMEQVSTSCHCTIRLNPV